MSSSIRVHLNGFDHRVVLVRGALWDSSGGRDVFRFTVGENTGDRRLALNLADGGLSPLEPSCADGNVRPLALNGIEHVDLVKIDAEAEARRASIRARCEDGRIDAVVCDRMSAYHRLLCGFGFVPQPYSRCKRSVDEHAPMPLTVAPSRRIRRHVSNPSLDAGV
jgi:hypothetical protein